MKTARISPEAAWERAMNKKAESFQRTLKKQARAKEREELKACRKAVAASLSK